MIKNAVELSHHYLKFFIKNGAFVVDATCGNGGDTVFLASLVGENGLVFGFDIQKEAIQNTKKRVENEGYSSFVQLFLDGHENMEAYLGERKADAFVFNLGYLPKGDHTIHTKGETTIKALEIALSHLSQNGIIALSIYHGGDSGFEERDAVLAYLEALDSKKYNVVLHNYMNKPNFPPLFVLICHNQ